MRAARARAFAVSVCASVTLFTLGASAQPSAAFPEEEPPPRAARPSAPPERAPAAGAPAPRAAPPPERRRPAPAVTPAPAPPRVERGSTPAPVTTPQAGAPRERLPAQRVGTSSPPPQTGLPFRPPALVPYRDLEPPPGYVRVDSMNTGLFVGGLVTFGAMYATSLAYGATRDFDGGLGWVAAPLIGPWIAIGQRDFSCTIELSTGAAEECQARAVDEAATLAVLSGLGIGQMVGFTLSMLGVFDRESMWVRADLLGARLEIEPTFYASRAGLSVRGVF